MTSGEEWTRTLYATLRSVAASLFRHERPDAVLQPTAVIHEAYLRLQRNRNLGTRTQFLTAAVAEMRRVLIDEARRRGAIKRGGGQRRLKLDTRLLSLAAPTMAFSDLHEALERLAQLSPRQARIVELRFLAGLTEQETAESLGVALRTVQQNWRGAKVWLRRELAGAATEIVDEPCGGVDSRAS